MGELESHVIGCRSRPMRLMIVVLFVGQIAACGMPRDPEGTLQRVTDGIMRAGISENPPWTRIHGGRLSGIEVRLLRQFARELSAQIEWVQGSEAELLEALRNFELDVVIAGLTYDSPWSTEVGMTQPYYTSILAIGAPVGMPLPGDFSETLEGYKIGVPLGRAVGGYVEEAGAVPVPVKDRPSYPGPIAAYTWQLKRWGFKNTGVTLYEYDHVIAVPPGENGWLVELEHFVLSRRNQVHAWLIGEPR